MSSKVRFGPNLLITIPARGFWKRRIMKASQKFALDHTLIGSKASCTTGGNHRSDYTGVSALLGSLPKAGWLLADTPYEYICKIWTSEPDLFIVDPIHQMPGLNT